MAGDSSVVPPAEALALKTNSAEGVPGPRANLTPT